MTDPSSQISDSNKQNISGSIRISSRQKGNPVLKHIRKVPWEFEEGLVADYILGPSCVALYLSVRYYTLQPDYIHERIKLLGRGHRLRVLLVQVDVKVGFCSFDADYTLLIYSILVSLQDPQHALSQLMRIAILSELTLMLAWNVEEAAAILETYKLFENKPPDLIMERSGGETHEKVIEALTSVKSVNKTDAVTLLGTFGTLAAIIRATPEDLALCPGFGPNKAKKLHKVFSEQFRRNTEVNPSQKGTQPQISDDKDDFDDDDAILENL